MAELRKHPLLERWVIVNDRRAARPGSTLYPRIIKKNETCQFCAGNESHTPPEVHAIRGSGEPNSSGWKVRVIPNKYPILERDGVVEHATQGLYRRMTGYGVHEVVIESPDHHQDLQDLDLAHFTQVIETFQFRFRDLKRDPHLKYIKLFKNHGAMGGASLEHTHCQIIGMPIVTKNYLEEERTALEHLARTQHCIFCDLVAQERLERSRVVLENDDFIAFCPFAPSYAYETWVMPKAHHSHFEQLSSEQIKTFAELFRSTLRRLSSHLENPAYNFMLHTAPVQEGDLTHYHWRVEIVPQLGPIAGFERGSGFYVTSVAPERAAELLRSVDAVAVA